MYIPRSINNEFESKKKLRIKLNGDLERKNLMLDFEEKKKSNAWLQFRISLMAGFASGGGCEGSGVHAGGGWSSAAMQRGQMACQGQSENSGNSNDEKPSESFRRAGRHAGNPGSCGNYHLEAIRGHPCLKDGSTGQCGLSVWSVCSEQTNRQHSWHICACKFPQILNTYICDLYVLHICSIHAG